MRELPGEANGARVASFSLGLPQGTKIDLQHAPQEPQRVPRAPAPAPMKLRAEFDRIVW